LEQTEEFFVTGLEKYLDAKAAVTMFEEEVQRRVKKVVNRHQGEFTEWFGKSWPMKDYSETSQMPEYMYLGQQVALKGSGVLYFSLAFWHDEKGSSGLSPTVIFWRQRVTLLKPVWDAVKAIQDRDQNPNLGIRNDRFWLTGAQPSPDWNSCESVLDSVIIDWIELWKTLGGLLKNISAQTPAM